MIAMILMMSLAFIKSSEARNQSVGNMQVVVNQTNESTGFPTQQNPSVSDSCTAYFKGTINVNNCRAGEVPLPAATWLFILALIAFVGLSNKSKI